MKSNLSFCCFCIYPFLNSSSLPGFPDLSFPGISLPSLAASLQVSLAGSFDSLGFSARSLLSPLHLQVQTWRSGSRWVRPKWGSLSSGSEAWWLRLVRVLEWGGGGHSGVLLILASPKPPYSKDRMVSVVSSVERWFSQGVGAGTSNSTRRRVSQGSKGHWLPSISALLDLTPSPCAQGTSLAISESTLSKHACRLWQMLVPFSGISLWGHLNCLCIL